MTTSQELIKVLLSKYHIMDNPRKFALYEKSAVPGKTGELSDYLWSCWTDSVTVIVDACSWILGLFSIKHYCLHTYGLRKWFVASVFFGYLYFNSFFPGGHPLIFFLPFLEKNCRISVQVLSATSFSSPTSSVRALKDLVSGVFIFRVHYI